MSPQSIVDDSKCDCCQKGYWKHYSFPSSLEEKGMRGCCGASLGVTPPLAGGHGWGKDTLIQGIYETRHVDGYEGEGRRGAGGWMAAVWWRLVRVLVLLG